MCLQQVSDAVLQWFARTTYAISYGKLYEARGWTALHPHPPHPSLKDDNSPPAPDLASQTWENTS